MHFILHRVLPHRYTAHRAAAPRSGSCELSFSADRLAPRDARPRRPDLRRVVPLRGGGGGNSFRFTSVPTLFLIFRGSFNVFLSDTRSKIEEFLPYRGGMLETYRSLYRSSRLMHTRRISRCSENISPPFPPRVFGYKTRNCPSYWRMFSVYLRRTSDVHAWMLERHWCYIQNTKLCIEPLQICVDLHLENSVSRAAFGKAADKEIFVLRPPRSDSAGILSFDSTARQLAHRGKNAGNPDLLT